MVAGGPSPVALTAEMEKVYFRPVVSPPTTVSIFPPPLVLSCSWPGNEYVRPPEPVTTYRRTGPEWSGEPLGRYHPRVTALAPAFTHTFLGGPDRGGGGEDGPHKTDVGSDGVLDLPEAFATAEKVYSLPGSRPDTTAYPRL
jgi:hypothetical protein